jgi:hypothetical protein
MRGRSYKAQSMNRNAYPEYKKVQTQWIGYAQRKNAQQNKRLCAVKLYAKPPKNKPQTLTNLFESLVSDKEEVADPEDAKVNI